MTFTKFTYNQQRIGSEQLNNNILNSTIKDGKRIMGENITSFDASEKIIVSDFTPSLNSIDENITGETIISLNFNNDTNAFDNNDSSYAYGSSSSPGYIGKTFDSQLVEAVYINLNIDVNHPCTLQTYDGTTWDDFIDLYYVDSGKYIIFINKTISGFRLNYKVSVGDGNSFAVYSIKIGNNLNGEYSNTSTAYTEKGLSLNITGDEDDTLETNSTPSSSTVKYVLNNCKFSPNIYKNSYMTDTSNHYVKSEFTSKLVEYIGLTFFLQGTVTSCDLETYDGSTWTSIKSYSSSTFYDEVVEINDTIQGIRLNVVGNTGDMWYYKFKYGSFSDAELSIDIPTGKFTSTANLVATTWFESFISRDDVQIKFTNDTEDSGWLNIDELNTLSFTSEPTRAIVKLLANNNEFTPTISKLYIEELN